MLRKIGIFMVVLITFSLSSCSPKQSEIVLAEYGKYEIKMTEFEKAYAKNVGSLEEAKKDSLDELKKFLGLYVNYKMKLRDAEVRELNKSETIKNELDSYEKSIGASYILEKELYKKGIKALYDKRSEELRVSHLLIRIDTLSEEKAKQKALDIIARIKDGSSFEEEVKKHTEDQFSKSKGGDIYYITAGSIQPSFEDLAYATPVGTVNPTPLKTKYGYHIIKVTERNKRTPKIKASHILISNKGPDGKVDDKSRIELAKSVLEKAKNGEDFEKLAAEYSDDPGSKTKGGSLGFFSRRQMVQAFDEVVFNLKVGEVSDIVETQFGFHIIKLIERQEYPKFEDERKSLRNLYERTRKKNDYDILLENYSNEVNLVMHDEVFKDIVSNINGTKINKEYWTTEFQNKFGSSVLFTIGEFKFNTDSLFAYTLKENKNNGSVAKENLLSKILTEYKNTKVLETKAQLLASHNLEFAQLMDEYKNGIYIFNLQENEVWNKMKMDSNAIQTLYQETKENYVTTDRVQFTELFTKSDSLAMSYYEMLKNGDDFDTLLAKYNEKKKTKLNNSATELVGANKNKLSLVAFSLNTIGDFSEVTKNENGWSIVKLIKKDPSRIKTFEEARAEVTSSYQDIESAHLENAYISRLNKTYSSQIFYEELENVYKN